MDYLQEDEINNGIINHIAIKVKEMLKVDEDEDPGTPVGGSQRN